MKNMTKTNSEVSHLLPENVGLATPESRRMFRFHTINPLFAVLSFVGRHWRGLAAMLLMAAGGYLLWTGFNPDTDTGVMRGWLKKSGDADLLRYYDEAKDAKERNSLCIAFKAYEKQYGKGAWVQHFKRENFGGNIAYRDIAELAVGISSQEEREAFLASHAATYEACVQNGEIELAHHYGETLKELREKGGKAWSVASRNPFAICVYDVIKQDDDSWNWYLENAEWGDSFLMTLEPELQDGNPANGDALVDAIKFMRECSSLLKQFHEEISALSEDELKEIADGDNLEECKEALFASSFAFVGEYHNVLSPMLKAPSRISMLEAMAVVANNRTAFGLGEEDAVDSPNKSRNAAMGFVRIHDERKLIWDFAMDEWGIDCIAFCEKVCNYEWCEQVIGMFGEAGVVTFLNKYYSESSQLLRAATETLYRCQETGWAVLQKYRDNPQVKSLLQNPRIGFRLIPYYLQKGYDGFTQLDEDERWIDEMLDKNGNLKRMDVSWYEMSPVGGDVATVVKKWAQGRPVTSGELAWATFDMADTAAMAFSFGMSKVATSGVKTATKTTARRIGQRAAGKIATKISRRLPAQAAVRTMKHTSKAGARKISFYKKITKWFKKAPGVVIRGTNSAVGATRKKTVELLGNSWKAARKVDPKTWQNIYKGTKALMWCRYLAHTVPEKLPDAIHAALESAGEFVGKTINSLVAGAGDGLKAAVREVLGLPKGSDYKLINWILGCTLFVLGLCMFSKIGNGQSTH